MADDAKTVEGGALAAKKNAIDGEFHKFPSGEALIGNGALAVTRAAPARVIVVAGPANSGKTTLLATLYERFHFGLFGGYLFAGSRTLVGFERRCHLARRASGRETPDTERTRRLDALPLLHLAVRKPDAGRACDLLITDIYGETFRLAADSTEDCQQLDVLRRADHVAILVDGERLTSQRERQEAFTSAESLLRSCLDAGMMDGTSQVELLITKWDLVLRGTTRARADFIDSKKARLLRRYAERLARLEWLEVASRPSADEELPQAYGLDKLLHVWVENPRGFLAAGGPEVAQGPAWCEFDRFGRVSARPAEVRR